MANPFDQFDEAPAASGNPFDQFDAPSTNNPKDFSKAYGPAAERAAKSLNVDPSVLLGQWGLETGWGKSIIPGTNNLGNIKDFRKDSDGVEAVDNMNGSRDKYRKYASAEAFADDFSDLISRKYKGAIGAKTPEAFAKALKAGGYAEDPDYVNKVVAASRMGAPAAANPFDQFDGMPPDGPEQASYSNEGRNRPKNVGKASIGTGILSAFADVGNMADTAGSLIGGGIAGLVGQDEIQAGIYRGMEGRNKERQQFANPEGQELGFGAKAAGLVATLPMQMAASGLGAATTGKELLDSGESLSTALKGAGVDAAGNVAGMILPGFKQGSAMVRAGTGVAANAGQEYATKAAISGLAETKAGKERFAPNMEDVALAGMLGGATAVAAGRSRPPNPSASRVDSVLGKSQPPAESGGISPERIARIQEAANRAPVRDGSQPITVDRLGEAVTPETDAGTLLARERATEQMSGELDAQARAQRLADQPPRVTDDLQGQADLFESGNPTPYTLQEGQWHIDENGMPIRSDLSMEANALEQPLQRGLWGEELGPALEQDRGLTQAIDTMPAGPERMGALETLGDVRTDDAILAATADALKTPKERLQERYSEQTLADKAPVDPVMKEAFYGKDGNVQIRQTATGFEAVIGDKVVGRLESNMTPEQNKQLRDMGENIPATVDIIKVSPELQGQGIGSALQNAWRGAHNDNIAPSGKTTQAAWNMWKRNMPEKVEAFVTAEADRIKSGSNIQQVMSNITDPDIRQRVAQSVEAADAIIDVATGEVPTISNWQPMGGSRGRKQGGFIVIPGRKKPAGDAVKGMGVFKNRMKNFVPETMDNATFLEANKNLPDIEQNIAQRMANSLTKGGLYQAEKTGDPFVKRVTERFRDATQTSLAKIRDIVHDDVNGYAPMARKLDKTEFIEVAQMLQKASRDKIDINLAAMREAGYSGNAIKMVAQHQDAMKTMETGPMAEAMKLNGIQGVKMETAYAAANSAGDFRRVVYAKDDPSKTIGILSAKTKYGLDRIVKRYEAQEGAGTVGEQRYFGGGRGKAGTSEGFQQMLEFLASNDPDIRNFVKGAADALQGDAKDFMNVKRHTMDKKGVFGMQGDKFHKDAYANASDFFDSQVSYIENVIKWSEMSKAVSETKEVMAAAKPNTKALLSNYVDGALGKNPTLIGRGVDDLMGKIGEATGLGTTVGSNLLNVAKKVTNAKLLGLNIPFIATQIIQPLKVMPEMTQFLAGRGLNTSIIGGYASLGKAFVTMMKEQQGANLDGVTKGALEYADRKHVYSSDLFENSNSVRKDGEYYFNKYSQIGAANAEYVTRKGTYLAFVDMLHENGVKVKDGLYEAAHNLTDVAMNNYNSAEAPQIYNAAGAFGRASYNLMSYKHNELSRMAMFARDLPNNQYGRAFATNIAAQIAFGGIMGTVGYQEADWLVRKITEKFGKPMSISGLLLQGGDEDWKSELFKYGMFSAVGVDATSRLGMGTVLPDSLGSALMPGGSALVDAAASVGEAVVNPTEYNAKKALIGILPNGLTGPLERKWFSRDTPQGEMAMNKNKAMPSALRNETDKTVKSFGATGLNESKQKKINWDLSQTDKFYTDKRKDALMEMREAFVMNPNLRENRDWTKAQAKFMKAQGDPNTFNTEIEKYATDLNLTAKQLADMKNAGSTSITNLQKLLRSTNYD